MIVRCCLFLLLFSSWGWGQNWLLDWDKAIEIAIENKQDILLVFSGSDWCIPCIRLENEVWNSKEFIEYANNNLVLYRADFPK